MKFPITNKTEFDVDFPEDVDNILGRDAECFWRDSKRCEHILVSSAFDLLLSLKHAIGEVLSGVREVSGEACVGNIGKAYNESNYLFLEQIENCDVDLPRETKYGIWLGDDMLTFIYSYNKVNYIEVSPSYPYFYTEGEKNMEFKTWMLSFETVDFSAINEEDLRNWLEKIESFLPR